MRRRVLGLPAADLALALGLLAVRLFTLVSGLQPGFGAISYLTAIGMTVPFARRSRNPLAVAVLVCASNVAEVAFGGYRDSVVALAGWLILPYSLGAYCTSAVRLVAGLAVVVATGNWLPTRQGPVTFWNTVGVNGLLAACLLAGLWVRQMRLRGQALEELAAQLGRERDERARVAVAEERARIARELHDEVAHAMTVIAVQADAAEGALARDPALVASPLAAIRDTARDALADMRRVLGALRNSSTEASPELAPEPGLARIAPLVAQARAAGLVVELRTEGAPVTLPAPVDAAAYRVVQEGLTNVLRHAAAHRVEILLSYGHDAVDVRVTDDGNGTGPGGGSGYGLTGIRERVAVLGGRFAADRRRDGFVLQVTLPLA